MRNCWGDQNLAPGWSVICNGVPTIFDWFCILPEWPPTPSTVVDRLRERGLREGAPGIGSLSFSDILFFCAKSRNRKRLTPKSDGIVLAIAAAAAPTRRSSADAMCHITPLRRHIAPLWLLWFLVHSSSKRAWIQRHASFSLLRHCDCGCGVTAACVFGCGCGDVSKRTSGRYSRSLLHHVVCGCGVTAACVFGCAN